MHEDTTRQAPVTGAPDLEADPGLASPLIHLPLAEVPFVVVDLETTGGRAGESHITEIGAVKVRGGEVLGEFHTLVDPGVPVPAFIQVLTGITDEMLAGSPRIESVIPAFLEFARGCVLVAHNAPFDVGFLRASTRALGLTWPAPPVVDTVVLARRLVSRDEVPNHKLGTLAAHFGAVVTPDHRALHDARATVDVLHALIARAGSQGPWAAGTIADLERLASRVHPVQRLKRHLADGLPGSPGAFMFVDDAGVVLYVGRSHDIRRRVASYFTAGEQRARIIEMLQAAAHVVPVPCETHLESRVRCMRLIAEHAPHYNRRGSRTPARAWLRLTAEPFPRVAVVHRVEGIGLHVGPFPGRVSATAALETLHELLPLRRCTTRLRRDVDATHCPLATTGECAAPCRSSNQPAYAAVVGRLRSLVEGTDHSPLESLRNAVSRWSGATLRDEPNGAQCSSGRSSLIGGLTRTQRLAPLLAADEIVAAKRRDIGGWEVVDVRAGRLARTVLTPPGEDPVPYISAMRAAADADPLPPPHSSAALTEEAEILHEWLVQDGVRLVDLVGSWTCPVHGAERLWADEDEPPTMPRALRSPE